MTELAVDRPLDESDLDEVARARRAASMVAPVGPEAFLFERISRVGYSNRNGQQVIRKTNRSGLDTPTR